MFISTLLSNLNLHTFTEATNVLNCCRQERIADFVTNTRYSQILLLFLYKKSEVNALQLLDYSYSSLTRSLLIIAFALNSIAVVSVKVRCSVCQGRCGSSLFRRHAVVRQDSHTICRRLASCTCSHCGAPCCNNTQCNFHFTARSLCFSETLVSVGL